MAFHLNLPHDLYVFALAIFVGFFVVVFLCLVQNLSNSESLKRFLHNGYALHWPLWAQWIATLGSFIIIGVLTYYSFIKA